MKRHRQVVTCGFFMLVIATGAACKQDNPVAPRVDHPEILSSFEPLGEDGGSVLFEGWYLIRCQGQRAGSSHLSVRRMQTPLGVRLKAVLREKLVFLRAGTRLEMGGESITLEDEQGQLLRYRQVQQQARQEGQVVEAGRVGSEWVTVQGPQVKKVPFDPDARGPLQPYGFLLKRPVQPGEIIRYRSIQTMTGGYLDSQVEVLSVESGSPRVAILKHHNARLQGQINQVRLDESLRPLEEESQLGDLLLSLKRSSAAEAQAPVAQGVDLTPWMGIETAQTIAHPDDLSWARYRLQGVLENADVSAFSGPGQRVVAQPASGVLLIEVTRLDDPLVQPFPAKAINPDLSAYLVSTSEAQSDDPTLAALARRLTEGSPDLWTAAKRLRNWVREEISADLDTVFASAAQTLKQRSGDCTEKAVLLAALARAVGIPSRCVMGVVYNQGRFARHMWTEVWVGQWRPLDAAFGPERVSAARLRLGIFALGIDGGPNEREGLETFVSRLKIIVEQVATPSDPQPGAPLQTVPAQTP